MKRSPHQQCKEPVCFMLNSTPLVILDSEIPSSHVRLAFHLYFIHAVVGASDCEVLTVLWFTPYLSLQETFTFQECSYLQTCRLG